MRSYVVLAASALAAALVMPVAAAQTAQDPATRTQVSPRAAAIHPPVPAVAPRKVTVLTLGTALPDTGSLKAYGPATQAAVRLAVEDANAAGGVLGSPIVLAPQNSGGQGSGIFARTMARLSGAQAIVGPLSSPLVLDNLPVIEGRTLVSPATASGLLTGVLARVVPAEPLAGAMLATLAKDRGAVRIVVVGPRDQQPLMDAALDRARDIGLETSSVVYGKSDSTRGTVSRIVRASADAMLLASGAETSDILRDLIARGMPATVLLSPLAADSVDAGKLRRGTLSGAVTVEVDLRVPRGLGARVKALAPQASKTAYSPQAYDAAAIAILAAEQSGRLLGEITPEGIRAALPAVTDIGMACSTLEQCLRWVQRGADIDYVGYGGPFALDSAGDPGKARYLARTFTVANQPGSSTRPVRYP
jgi:branched-chain amino acid transport system substrate-binding protein